jgi:hypothetical protein
MGIPSPYGIETLSIYRDRDLRQRPRERPRERPDRDKSKEKDLETVKSVFAELLTGNGSEASFVGAIGLWREGEHPEAWALHGGLHE